MDLKKAPTIVVIKTDKAPGAIGPYNQGTKVGNMVYTSGQIGMNLDGNLVGEDVESQTEQAMQNLKAVLEAGGASLESVFKTTVFLTSMSDFPKINPIYAKFFEGSKNLPARACVAVAELPKGAKFEVEAIGVAQE